MDGVFPVKDGKSENIRTIYNKSGAESIQTLKHAIAALEALDKTSAKRRLQNSNRITWTAIGCRHMETRSGRSINCFLWRNSGRMGFGGLLMLDKIKALCRIAAETDENIYAYSFDYDEHILDPNTSDDCAERLLAARQRKIDEYKLAGYVPSNEEIITRREHILDNRDRCKLRPICLPPGDRATGQEHHHICFAARILGTGFKDHCPAGLTSMLDVEYSDACDICPYFGVISVDSDGLHFALDQKVVDVFKDKSEGTDA